MSEVERTINRGLVNLNACKDNIEQGNKQTSIAFLKITKRIIDEYPKQTEYLQVKYSKIVGLYETKFGKLEKELL